MAAFSIFGTEVLKTTSAPVVEQQRTDNRAGQRVEGRSRADDVGPERLGTVAATMLKRTPKSPGSDGRPAGDQSRRSIDQTAARPHPSNAFSRLDGDFILGIAFTSGLLRDCVPYRQIDLHQLQDEQRWN